MLKMALLGRNIQHSYSPKIYSELLEQEFQYHLLDYGHERSIPELVSLLKEFPHLSVTAPYKKFCFEKAEELTQSARSAQSVNALKMRDGVVVGTNTDVLAFSDLFHEYSQHQDFDYLILGDGAMSTMITNALDNLGVSFEVFSRKRSNLALIDNYAKSCARERFLINTCSREYHFSFSPELMHTVWDMNYHHPTNESFVKSSSVNVRFIDGISILRRQAQYALSFWNL